MQATDAQTHAINAAELNEHLKRAAEKRAEARRRLAEVDRKYRLYASGQR